MEQYTYKCPYCGDTLLLSDVVGIERMRDAIGWSEQQDIYEEWDNYINEHKISCGDQKGG